MFLGEHRHLIYDSTAKKIVNKTKTFLKITVNTANPLWLKAVSSLWELRHIKLRLVRIAFMEGIGLEEVEGLVK